MSDFLAGWLEGQWLPDAEQCVLTNYYKSYVRHFGPYVRFHYDNQTRELFNALGHFDGPAVLEVGCGCGTESLYMALLGAHVLGVDLREDRLAVARKRLELLKRLGREDVDCRFEARSFFDLQKEGGFDIIWLEQAFHHIEPRREAVGMLASLLRPGGFVIISEANAWNPLMQIMLFRQRGFRTISEYVDATGRHHLYGKERVVTPAALFAALGQEKLEKVSLRYFRLSPNWSQADSLVWVEKYVPQAFRFAFTHYNAVARKPGRTHLAGNPLSRPIATHSRLSALHG